MCLVDSAPVFQLRFDHQLACIRQEKEYYAHVTEAENEKRRRDHLLDMRDRAIADWEEDEARRKGLLASTTLEASVDHFRGLLLEVRSSLLSTLLHLCAIHAIYLPVLTCHRLRACCEIRTT